MIICEPDEIIESSDENHKRLSDFLSNFNLQSNIPIKSSSSKKSLSPQKEILSPDKFRRLPRRTRNVLAISRCPNVPFSSPLGQFLIQKSSTISAEYVYERLDRIDRFSFAPPIIDRMKPKWLEKRSTFATPLVTFKKTNGPRSKYHYYNFPRRQFSTLKRDADLEYLNSLLLKRCQPCSVPLKKLSPIEVNAVRSKICLKRLHNNNNLIIKRIKPLKIVEFIDLCSSDDEDAHTEQSDSTSKSCTTTSSSTSTTQSSVSSSKTLKPNQMSSSPISSSSSSLNNNSVKESISNTFPSHIDGNIVSIPIETATPTPTTALIISKTPTNLITHDLTLPKPLQPSVFLFSNFNNTSSTFYDSINGISNKMGTTTSINENNIIKFQNTTKPIPSLVRISSNTSSSSQRRSLTVTANL